MIAIDRLLEETPVLLEGAPLSLKRQRLKRSIFWTLLSFVASQTLCRLDVPAVLATIERRVEAPMELLRENWASGISPTAVIRLNQPHVRAALVMILLAPILWNGLARLEYHHRLWSRAVGGRRESAHRLFALYIVLFSACREYCVHRAVQHGPVWDLSHLHHGHSIAKIIRVVGAFVYAFGMVLSASGFWRLRLYTYMPEYFGLFCSEMVSKFPFNLFADPMYLGSALMHFGYALWCRSSTGLLLAVVLSLVYWMAARLIEEPFMHKLYGEEYQRRRHHHHQQQQRRQHLSQQKQLKHDVFQYPSCPSTRRQGKEK
jgi:protein-S-isoprenylcysteine O-methyltransferase Ste14